MPADLADRAAVARCADAARRPFGDPDILVNAAGVNRRPPLDELAVADWDDTLAVNLTAPFLLAQALVPAMLARGWGRVINVTSMQAERAFGRSGAYGVSKAGLAQLSRAQAEAWSARGVNCNSLAPGFFATPLTAAARAEPAGPRRSPRAPSSAATACPTTSAAPRCSSRRGRRTSSPARRCASTAASRSS